MSGVQKESFLKNVEKQFAAARVLEILGEASAKLTDEFKQAHPEIDWRGLKSMRNLLIHDYAVVDPEELWKAWEADIPSLKESVRSVLNGLE